MLICTMVRSYGRLGLLTSGLFLAIASPCKAQAPGPSVFSVASDGSAQYNDKAIASEDCCGGVITDLAAGRMAWRDKNCRKLLTGWMSVRKVEQGRDVKAGLAIQE